MSGGGADGGLGPRNGGGGFVLPLPCAQSPGGVSPPQQSPSCPLSPDPCGEDTVDPPSSANHGLATRGVVLTHLPQDGALLGLRGPGPS